MKTCRYCHHEIAEDAYLCRACGKIVPWKTHYSPVDNEPTYAPMSPRCRHPYRPLVLWILAFIVFLLAPVLAAGQSLHAQAKERAARNRPPSRVVLYDVFIDKISYSDRVIVTGKVKNVSSRNLEGVLVEATAINSLDEDISTVGVVVNPRILLAGGEAAFSLTIPVAVEQALRVRVKAVKVKEQLEIRRNRKWSEIQKRNSIYF